LPRVHTLVAVEAARSSRAPRRPSRRRGRRTPRPCAPGALGSRSIARRAPAPASSRLGHQYPGRRPSSTNGLGASAHGRSRHRRPSPRLDEHAAQSVRHYDGTTDDFRAGQRAKASAGQRPSAVDVGGGLQRRLPPPGEGESHPGTAARLTATSSRRTGVPFPSERLQRRAPGARPWNVRLARRHASLPFLPRCDPLGVRRIHYTYSVRVGKPPARENRQDALAHADYGIHSAQRPDQVIGVMSGRGVKGGW